MLTRAAAFLLASVLAACSSGGSVGAPAPAPAPTPAPTPTPPPSADAPPLEDNPTARSLLVSAGMVEDGTDSRLAAQRTLEFRRQPALNTIKADWAYARGQVRNGARPSSGAGIVIAIVDSAIEGGNREFAPAMATFAPGSTHADDLVDPNTSVSSNDPILPGLPGQFSDGHGTAVASVAAARKDGIGFHGIAPQARLYGRPHGSPARSVNFLQEDMTFAALFSPINQAAHVANNSYTESYTQNQGAMPLQTLRIRAGIRQLLPDTIAVLAQNQPVDQGPAGKTVYVWSAGNSDGELLTRENSPLHFFPTLPFYFPEELQNHWLVAAATDNDGEITEFSNHCGITGPYCLAAPGESVAVVNSGTFSSFADAYVRADGTSFSAPLISGSVALLLDFFGAASVMPEEVAARLLFTADKAGRYAPDSILIQTGTGISDQCASPGETAPLPDCTFNAIYGQGLLDLKAATEPVGQTRMATAGPALDRAQTVLSRLTGLSLAPAFGDALARGLAGQAVALFDELDAPFPVPLGGFVASPSRPDPARRLARMARASLPAFAPEPNFSFIGGRAQDLGSPLSRAGAQLFADARAFAPFMSLHGTPASFGARMGRIRLGLFSSLEAGDGADPAREAPGHGWGAALSWQALPSVALQGGFLREAEGVLAARGAGGLDLGAGETFFTGLRLSPALPLGWTLLAQGWLGVARAPDAGGLFTEIEPLLASAFEIGLWRQGEGSSFGLRLSQPLRAEKGRARLRFASARRADRSLVWREARVSLAPSGRERALEAAYLRALGPKTHLHVLAGVALQPGHVRAARPEARFLLNLRRAF